MVTKHPQLLHYSIEDGILSRINFLRIIGMRNSEILKVLTSLTQVLSLSLEANLRPKYLYLVNELRNEKVSALENHVIGLHNIVQELRDLIMTSMAGRENQMAGPLTPLANAQAVDIKLFSSLSREDLKKPCGGTCPEWTSFPAFE